MFQINSKKKIVKKYTNLLKQIFFIFYIQYILYTFAYNEWHICAMFNKKNNVFLYFSIINYIWYTIYNYIKNQSLQCLGHVAMWKVETISVKISN